MDASRSIPPSGLDSPPSRAARAALGLLAFAVFAPILRLPFMEEDFQVLYWARASALDPRWFFHAWYGGGGAFGRFVPKLLMAGLMSTAGPVHVVYQLLNLAFQAASTLLVARLARVWTGSTKTGLTAAFLFAVGFGFYGKTVMKINNLHMTLGLTLALWSLVEWQAGRRMRAAAVWVLAVSTHEITAMLPLIAMFAPRSGAPPAPAQLRRAVLITLGALGLICAAAWFTGRLPRFADRMLAFPSFVLVPINVGPALRLRFAGIPVPGGLIALVETHRVVVGLALMLPLAWAAARDAVLRFGVVWMFILWLPAAVLMTLMPGEHLEMRYLYMPAVGVCVFAASLLDRIRLRPGRRVVLAVAVAASLLLDGFVYVRQWQILSEDPRRARQSREFWPELAELNRTHRPNQIEIETSLDP